ncbi:hypothetical protein C1H46_013890 [Malus baccata]|uniref:Acyl-CoA thioesterase 2 C-terminal domain-containing protein n=1 Tax=Malus baccata TaxID=106549 RepID=A0A540MP25_MALBA|nr:hypothetical protein C1H46_013890 [Malus baccata]
MGSESGSGECVVREAETGDRVYFEGEMKGNRPELKLKRCDYFGYGFASIEHQADVIALSKLICLVLAHENCTLLQPKSIWNADKAQKTCSLVENILHLDPIEVNIFQGITLLDTPQFGQALAAATKTVDCLKLLHMCMHIFCLLGILTKEEGSVHQQATMPYVPVPDTLLSMEELHEKRLLDPHLPRCVVAYASDLMFSNVSLNPHRRAGVKLSSVSLDHAMWFHRPVRADDWLLYVMVSPIAYDTHGFVLGQMFYRNGEVVVSLTQESLNRPIRPTPAAASKL